MHHTDQGVQYAAKAYTQLLEQQGIAISMAAVGEAWQKGYAPATDANDQRRGGGFIRVSQL
ncbi:hypothetical protein H6F67_00450 [Microcoleus sp. FACHB-1515]|nr:hypothetical protein [Microcoleus sp. FACHB-1515]